MKATLDDPTRGVVLEFRKHGSGHADGLDIDALTAKLHGIAVSAADHLLIVSQYGASAELAATQERIAAIRAAIQEAMPTLPHDGVERAVGIVTAVMLDQVNALLREKISRLRAEILARGGVPDDPSKG